MFMIELLIDILMSIFTVYILMKFLGTFFEKKKINWAVIMMWSIYFGWQLATSIQNNQPAYENIMVVIMLTLIVSIVTYEGGVLKKSIFSMVFNTLAMLMETLCAYIFMFININYVASQLVGAIMSKLMFFVLIFYLNKVLLNKDIRELPKTYSIMLLIVPMGSVYVVYNTFFLSNNQNEIGASIRSLVSSLIMMVINILVFTVYMKLAEEMEIKRCNTVYEQQLELCNSHMYEKELAMMEFRNARHDMKQKLFALLAMAEAKEYDDIIKYIHGLVENNSFELLGFAHTGNNVIDSLINYKYSVAKRKKIDLEIDLQLPTQVPFQSADLCVILGNALDNALEATYKIQDKYIKLFMKYDRKNLTIAIANSFDGYLCEDSAGCLRTIKNDKVNHGIGLKSIRKTVNKYNGSLVIQHTDKEFVLKILLYS